MKTEINTLAVFVLLLVSIVWDFYKRRKFNQGIEFHSIILLKHKDFRTYSIGSLVPAAFIILLEILKFKSQSDVLNYTGFLCLVLVNVNAVFKLSNFTALSDEGIWIDGKKNNWEKIKSIGKNEYSYIITVKNTVHYIHFNEFENDGEFKKEFSDGVKRYSKSEYTEVKI
ncbi:MAG: hypothetical protein PHT07_01160 [Paludibacter sp.]|nr:hypothetical protein [Paludibacter sp.]